MENDRGLCFLRLAALHQNLLLVFRYGASLWGVVMGRFIMSQRRALEL